MNTAKKVVGWFQRKARQVAFAVMALTAALGTLLGMLPRSVGYAAILAAALLAFQAFTGVALADGDDITTTITSISGYWTAIKVVALGVILFVLGRRIIRKV